MVTDKQLANLNPAKEGEVRNPNGRPVGAKSAKTILKKILAERIDFETKDGQKKSVVPEDEIWQTAVAQAMTGDKDARRDVYDRLEGKPVQYSENAEVILTPEEQLLRIRERKAEILAREEESKNGESES